MDKLVSIIIPAFNSSVYIRETLDSVLLQTYTNWECIIVDDESIDNTIEIVGDYIRRDFRFKLLKRPNAKPKGVSSCRNFGIENALGDYVVFLDSDDLLTCECIQNRMLFVEENSDKDFWIFKMGILKNNKKLSILFNEIPKFMREEEFYITEFQKGKIPIYITCPLWKIDLLKKINGFDENLLMLEDPDLHLRAFKLGISVKTAIDYDFDCFYRIKSTFEREKTYNGKVLKYSFYFLKKHFDKNDENVKDNFKRIYNLYVFQLKSFRYNFKMSFLALKYGLFGIRHFLISIIILFYHFFGLKYIEGSGYFYLRKKFNKF